MNLCPCGSSRLYSACCGPYLKGAAAPTAEALMRSRYSAYTLGDISYIERTCAGPAADMFSRNDAALSAARTEWLGLTIVSHARGLEGDEIGTVGFTFEGKQNGQHFRESEVSFFRKIDGLWFYWDRETPGKSSGAAGKTIGRNDPCPCGSGKKYKKCCGA
ncbi:YchJ family protein [Rhizobium sp. L1K21]|uniref:YchJ family protein n=1 Tax=Rhizobium sp. L1K21 TaxID=2954933 RepID=UPI0020925C71|nr:YchJ family protein [Rhizobium sp. L1K21]MCO6186599.1 YchJ family protein [Rhizobium sp. L1K21]